MEREVRSKDIGFAFIHGGGFGPWVWERVIPFLNFPTCSMDRYPSQETNIRKLTITDCAEFVREKIEAVGFETVVLVAHSGGGIIAPEVAVQLPQQIKHIVFIAANIPPEDRCALDVLPLKERLINRIAIFMQAYGMSMPQKQIEYAIREIICHDVDKEGIEIVLQHGVVAEPPALALERVSRVNMPDISRTYIKLLQDRTLTLEGQDRMIENLQAADVVEIDSGHTVMLSHPERLAEVLNQIAEQIKNMT